MSNSYLITGSAGFIGYHISKNLLSRGARVLGIDALTDYYDKNLKIQRNNLLKKNNNYQFYEQYLENKEALETIFKQNKIDNVIHLAAQAGVRYSLENPEIYVKTNVLGSFNLLDVVKNYKINHLLLASTSSVYGSNDVLPFKETHRTDNQVSIYASTKKSMEVLSHTYSHIYKIPTTVFRFFTVYGPWGRPDMALFKFTKNILEGKNIEIFNNGNMTRNFTYIDDLVISVSKLIGEIPDLNSLSITSDSLSNSAPWRAVNIGGSNQVNLMDFIKILENELGIEAKKTFLKMQLGDVKETNSSNELLNFLINYEPKTDIQTGIKNFVNWFKNYEKSKEKVDE